MGSSLNQRAAEFSLCNTLVLLLDLAFKQHIRYNLACRQKGLLAAHRRMNATCNRSDRSVGLFAAFPFIPKWKTDICAMGSSLRDLRFCAHCVCSDPSKVLLDRGCICSLGSVPDRRNCNEYVPQETNCTRRSGWVTIRPEIAPFCVIDGWATTRELSENRGRCVPRNQLLRDDSCVMAFFKDPNTLLFASF